MGEKSSKGGCEMKDGKPETMRDCLNVMVDSVHEEMRWKALSLFLGEMAESQGVDLDRAIFSDTEPQEPEKVEENRESRGRAERGWFSWVRKQQEGVSETRLRVGPEERPWFSWMRHRRKV